MTNTQAPDIATPTLAVVQSKPSYMDILRSIQPIYKIGFWPMDDPTGPTVQDLSGKTGSILERLFNGGFETAGAGAPDLWANWVEHASDGTVADETPLLSSGHSAHSVKLTSGANKDTWVVQNEIQVTPGELLTIHLWVYGDGAHPGRYGFYDTFNNGWIQALTPVSSSASAWVENTFTLTIPAGSYQAALFLAGPDYEGGLSYFDDISVKGTINNCNGIYFGSLTYRRPGPYPGTSGVTFPGSDTGAAFIGSPTFNSYWKGDKFSAIAWGKINNVEDWNDLSTPRYLFHVQAADDPTYVAAFGRDRESFNTLHWMRRVGGVNVKRTYTFAGPPLGWFCMGYSVDITGAGKERCYVYAPGVMEFTKVYDGPISGGKGAWGNHPVIDPNTCLFGGSPTSQLWIGDGGPTVCWSGITLTDDEMLRAMGAE
jgi:hypothetical protein